MSACTVCQHPQRGDIDEALRAAGGRGRNALARQYQLSQTTMGRHITLAHYQHREEPPMEPVPYSQEPEMLGTPDLRHELTRVQADLAAVQAALTRLEEQGSARTQARDQQVEARLASQEQRLAAQEADQRSLTRALDGMTATVGRVAEFFAQLKLDANLWAACLNIARSGSQGTHSSALKEWLAKVAGRQLSDNDKVLQ